MWFTTLMQVHGYASQFVRRCFSAVSSALNIEDLIWNNVYKFVSFRFVVLTSSTYLE
jgi:hypothetical protein